MPRIELERRDVEEDRDEVSFESFDRLAFAQQMVALIRPTTTRVAVFGGRKLRVESGRQWGREGHRWATVEIAPTSSRRAIVHAILAIRGEDAGDPIPFTLDLLLRPYR